MINLCARIAASSIVLIAMIGIKSGFAQGDRTIDQYTCKDVMRESGANRDTAIGFVHGYLLGKSGATSFNVENLEKQTDAFIERCLDNPNEKALDAMMKVKS